MTIEHRVPFASRQGYRWIVLAVGTLGVFAALGLARFGYTTVLPPMQQSLQLDNTAAGAMASANLAGYLLLSALGGALASRFGTRAVATCGLAVVSMAMILTGLAGDFGSACFWRGITGMGSGAANVAIMGMWAAWFGPRLRGRAAGIAVAGSSLALMATGIGVPRILTTVPADGWRLCWFLFGAAALAITILAWVLLRNRPGPDVANASAQPAAADSAPSTTAWQRLYCSRTIWHLGGIYIAFGFSYIIYMTFFVKYLVAEHGYAAAGAGRIFFLMGVCSVVCGFLWGAVSDFFGRKAALVAVYAVHTVAFALFGLSGSHVAVIVSAVLFGLSAWSIPAIMAAACGDVLGARLAAAGLGFITLFFGIGQAIAPSIAGALADVTGSFSWAFLLAAAVAFCGALASLCLRAPSAVAPGA